MDNIEEPPQPSGACELAGADEGETVSAAVEQLERPSFGARLRTIIFLSLLCWAALVAVVAWIFA